VYSIEENAATSVYVNFDCANQQDPSGAGTFNSMTYIINGQDLSCAVLFDPDTEHAATSAFLCGAAANVVASCANAVASGMSVGTQGFPVSPVWFTHFNTGSQ
jgi:hypothetical protein